MTADVNPADVKTDDLAAADPTPTSRPRSANPPPTGPAVLSVRDLTIVAPGGATLVENADFDIAAGELVLMVGPSGSGKSTIVNLLSGLPDALAGGWRVTGQLICAGRSLDLSTERSDVGGLVFQDNALFNDLTAGENLRIAADHAPPSQSPAASAQLRELATALLPDVDADRAVSSCSGGQRQRVAIARTLLADRPIIFFDEPNSGLDIRASRALAAMIRDICRQMGRPAIIVAHHVEDLLPEADRVLLLDTKARRLRQIDASLDTIETEIMALEPGASVKQETAAPGETPGESGAEPAPAQPRGGAEKWRDELPSASRLHWFGRYFSEYFWVLCASPLMIMYVALGGMIVGFVEIWFGYNYHSFGGYLKSLLHDETLVGLGLIEVTVAVPLIATILMVARNNAIIAADLGNRVLSSQFRAMANLKIPAKFYLIASIVANMVAGSVVLMAVSMSAAAWTSYKTWSLLFPGQSFELWQENFFRLFINGGSRVYEDLFWVLIKTVASAGLASLAGIVIGLRKKDSVVAINHAIADSIIAGVSITLFVHAAAGVAQF